MFCFVLFYFFQAKAMKFLYDKKVSHMDLKPENILLTSIDKPILKLAGNTEKITFPVRRFSIAWVDFGVAQHIGKQGSRSIRGTLMYMAPEILSSNPYDNRVDLWSIGVILYGRFSLENFFDEHLSCSRMYFRSTTVYF